MTEKATQLRLKRMPYIYAICHNFYIIHINGSLTWILFHPALLFNAQLLEVDLDLTDDLAFAIGLHVLHLHLQVLNALYDIERDDFIPDGVVCTWDLLRIGTVLLYAEADTSIGCNSGVGRSQLTSINHMHRQNASLHDVLVREDGVHVPRRFFL